MKKFLIVFVIIIAAGAGYYFYNVYFTSSKRVNPIYAVPGDAAYVLEFDDPFEAWKQFSNSSVWAHLKTNPFLADITNYADSLNEVVNNNPGLSKILASRPVIISGHPVRGDLEYFWVVDLKKTSQFVGFKNLLLPIFEKYYSISVREYHGYEILEMYDEEYHETLYMSIVDNLMIGSYRHVLVEASLDQIGEPILGRDLNFIEVKEELGFNGMFRLYLQWNILLSHLDEYITDAELLSELTQVFRISGFDLDYDPDTETLSLEGYTTMDDTVKSYYNMFHKTGSSRVTIPDIAPENTAFYSGLGFDGQESIASYLQEMLGEDEDFQKSKDKLESFLDISFEEHFFGWMDDEIAAIQTHVDRRDNSGYALIIKADDGDDARENLDFIAERIKKKTPVKFKQITYKDYQINYMSIQGLFRLIFGKLFKRLEKPYYTIIDDYVIFSNSPSTLRHIIDYKELGKTLSESADFNEHRDKYPRNSGIFLYTNAQYLINDIKELLDDATYRKVRSAEDYILCFPMAGLQVSADDGNYSNMLAISFSKDAITEDQDQVPVTVEYNRPDSALIDSLFISAVATEKEEEPIIPEEILPEDLDAKVHQEFFEDGKLRAEVRLKDGVKHGIYIEYAKDGHIILKGRFKQDIREGVWKEYDEKGHVVNRTRYRNGEAVN